MGTRTRSIYQYIWIPLRLALVMVLFFLVQHYLQVDLRFLANVPRTLEGLPGVVFSPLIHISYYHLLSNLFPLLCLGTAVFWFYGKVANAVLLRCYFVPQVLVWIFARPHAHVGSSGLVYGLAFFLIFVGFFRKDFKSLLISIVILLFFGGLFYGILPNQTGISWESHLAGVIAGGMSAFEFSKSRLRSKI
jgi:membrane associated rhomboid family serine protease